MQGPVLETKGKGKGKEKRKREKGKERERGQRERGQRGQRERGQVPLRKRGQVPLNLTAENTAGKVIQPVSVVVATDPPQTETTNNYQYDKNGNIISDSINVYEYDYNNRLTKATTSDSTITYTYDAA